MPLFCLRIGVKVNLVLRYCCTAGRVMIMCRRLRCWVIHYFRVPRELTHYLNDRIRVPLAAFPKWSGKASKEADTAPVAGGNILTSTYSTELNTYSTGYSDSHVVLGGISTILQCLHYWVWGMCCPAHPWKGSSSSPTKAQTGDTRQTKVVVPQLPLLLDSSCLTCFLTCSTKWPLDSSYADNNKTQARYHNF